VRRAGCAGRGDAGSIVPSGRLAQARCVEAQRREAEGGRYGRDGLRQAQDGAPRHQRQLPRDVRFLPVRHLCPADRARLLSERRPLRLADADVPELRRGLRHAPDRRAGSRSLCRPDGATQRPHRHAVDHGLRHGPDRLRAGLRNNRRALAAARRTGASAAGLFRRRRARWRLSLSLGDGHPRRQGLLRELAVGEPAGRGRGRRAAGLRHRQPHGAASGRRVGLAHPLLHRLRHRAVPLLDPPLARGDEGTGRLCSAAWRWRWW
jgi:hypothetical protein